MAARKLRKFHDEQTRAKIQATQLINRLQDCVFGKVEMTPYQVTAAMGLLKKVLPDLKQSEIKADVSHTFEDMLDMLDDD